MKEFINNNFFPLTIVGIVVAVCILGLIHIHKVEKYCETEESNGDWRCVTWGEVGE